MLIWNSIEDALLAETIRAIDFTRGCFYYRFFLLLNTLLPLDECLKLAFLEHVELMYKLVDLLDDLFEDGVF